VNVCLINLPMLQVYGKCKPAARHRTEIVIPLGLCYVAIALEQAGHKVSLIDADDEGLSHHGIMKRRKEELVDVVRVPATTPVYSNAKIIINNQ